MATTLSFKNDKSRADQAATKIFVQESSDSFTIAFQVTINGRTKHFNLDRKPGDALASALERIKLNMAKMIKRPKGSKNKVNQDPIKNVDSIRVELYQDGHLIDPVSTKNIDAWIDGAKLVLGEQTYTVGKNEPQISQLKLPSPLMRGFVALPAVALHNCDIDSCRFEWFRQMSGKEKNIMVENDATITDRIHFSENIYWLKVGEGFSYRPTDDDVAHLLKCVGEPRSSDSKVGLQFWTISKEPVELGPKECPFDRRHIFTSEQFATSDDRFRFISYNILADLYADSDYSRSVLFSHCPPYALAIDYRRQLLLKEIEGYKADIVCLQEVDKKEYIRFYEPYFKLINNHQGVFHTKGGQVAEGVATFFRRDRFELIDSHRTVLNKLIDPHAKVSKEVAEIDGGVNQQLEYPDADDIEERPTGQECSHPVLDNLSSSEAKVLLSKFDKMRSRISQNDKLYQRFTGRHTILQTNLLRVKGRRSDFLIVANTHFYFAPDADHIRLLQGCVCVKYLEYIKGYYTELIRENNLTSDEPRLSIIFCGDFNSTPDCGLYTLLQQGYIGDGLKDWRSNQDERVTDLSFSTSLRFSSAYKDIPYTNYTPLFNGCLDYIYFELGSLHLDRIVPLPKHDDVIASGGIPSDVFPSDHLALIADLKFI